MSFGQARNALTGVDLSVRRGEFVALIGASGCGKTTLLNVIAGLVPAAAGTVTVGGAPPAAGRADICYVLARDALLPWRTVAGNVEYGLELSGVGREERSARAATYIEKVGLLDRARSLPVAGFPRACGSACRWRAPSPSAAASISWTSPSARSIRRPSWCCTISSSGLWESSGATVVFVTHDIGEAITLADRVLVMSKKGTGVVDEIHVDLARPRSAEALQADAHYHDLYRRTWTSLKASAQ